MAPLLPVELLYSVFHSPFLWYSILVRRLRCVLFLEFIRSGRWILKAPLHKGKNGPTVEYCGKLRDSKMVALPQFLWSCHFGSISFNFIRFCFTLILTNSSKSLKIWQQKSNSNANVDAYFLYGCCVFPWLTFCL